MRDYGYSIDRRDIVVLGLLSVVLFSLIQPITVHMIHDRQFDYPLLIGHVESGFYLQRPNPLYYHLTLALTHLSPTNTVAYATHLLTVGFYGLTGVLLYLLYIRPAAQNPLNAGLWTGAILLVSAITLPTWGQPRLYLGYIVPNVYHNPTIAVLKPLILLLFWCIVRLFDDTKPVNRYFVAVAALLTILATTTKPTYTIALLPGVAMLLTVRKIRRQPIPVQALLYGIFIPAGLVLALQSGYINAASNQIIFAPFDFLQLVRAYEGLPQILLQFGLSIAFPAAVYVFYHQQAKRHLPLNLSWLVFGVGTGYAYLLNETAYPTHGNFFWSAQSGLFILFVVSAAFLLRHRHDDTTRTVHKIDYRRVVCMTLFLLHVLCGSVWYLAELTTNTPVWW